MMRTRVSTSVGKLINWIAAKYGVCPINIFIDRPKHIDTMRLDVILKTLEDEKIFHDQNRYFENFNSRKQLLQLTLKSQNKSLLETYLAGIEQFPKRLNLKGF